MVVELSPEIVKTVVSHIDDRETLCNCSLTCRRWLPASRFYLFRNISIKNRASYDILVRVRDVPYISQAFNNLYSLQLWEDQARPWLYLVPLTLGHRLGRVHLLTLLRFQWQEFPLHRSFYTIGYRMFSITTLTLVGGTFSSFAEFRRVVCSFESLSELILERVAWCGSPVYSHGTPVSRFPRLELLWVNSGSEGVVAALVDWLLGTASASSIRDLQLGNSGVQSSSDLPGIQRLTRALGASLMNYQMSLQASPEGIVSFESLGF